MSEQIVDRRTASERPDRTAGGVFSRTTAFLAAWCLIGALVTIGIWLTVSIAWAELAPTLLLTAVIVLLEYRGEVEVVAYPSQVGEPETITTSSPALGFMMAGYILLSPPFAVLLAVAPALMGGAVSPVARRRRLGQRMLFAGGNAGWSVVEAAVASTVVRHLDLDLRSPSIVLLSLTVYSVVNVVVNVGLHAALILTRGNASDLAAAYAFLWPKLLPIDVLIASGLVLGFEHGDTGGLALALVAGLAVSVAVYGAMARSTERRRDEEERADLLERVATASELERHRLALVLHDGVLQTVLAARLKLELAASRLPWEHAEVGAEMARISSTLDEAAEGIRRIIEGRGDPSDGNGDIASLLDAVGATVAPLFPQGCRVTCELTDTPDPASALCIYQVAREALMNAAKHANASRVDVFLASKEDVFVLEISDDGVGFVYDSAASRQGLGLATMKSRVAELGGSLVIRSSGSGGTRIGAQLPKTARSTRP